jgi:A/G-specific adenine glycosylase
MKERRVSSKQISSFQHLVYTYYNKHRRDLPWRNTDNPYHILVSEIMLQQTQVERVIEKYSRFVERFPDVASLAKATLKEILEAWQGLGYNRRAISLMKLAGIIISEYQGKLPANAEDLMKLPGIGRATAGCLLAFAFCTPSVFIETNIRRVFIHHFFQDREGIHDNEIMPLVEATLDRKNPRDWYYALMDYGSLLKKEIENPNKKSAHYTRQAPFEGSDRKIRGAILKTLIKKTSMTEKDIITNIGSETERTKKILSALVKEGFIIRTGKTFRIA